MVLFPKTCYHVRSNHEDKNISGIVLNNVKKTGEDDTDRLSKGLGDKSKAQQLIPTN